MKFKKMFFCLSIFFGIIVLAISSLGDQNTLCTGNNENLSCLKEHFDELATSNYKLFYKIILDSEKKAIKCKSTSDTISYLELANIKTTNVEFNEYFNEAIEKFFVKKPKCFLNALAAAKIETKRAVIQKLKAPLITDEAKITNIFKKFKREEKYKNIMTIYFQRGEGIK